MKFKELREATLTKTQIKKVHDKADDLPKNDFIKRYGKDGDSVRFATATKMVKKELGIEDYEEGFKSDAQRRAAFASGYKEKGKKKKEQVSEMMSAFSEMDRTILDEGMLRHIANNVIPRIADGTFGKIYRKFSEDNKGNSATVWDWYNACTDVLWKNPNQTKADFSNNAYVTDRMIEFTNKELIEVD